jgi:hypothetical protein
MIRSAIPVAAAILTAACFACAPAAAPPPPGSIAAGTLPSGQICAAGDPQSFINAIQLLDANSRPNGNTPPTGQPYSWPRPISDDLRNAFSSAPLAFQQRLCRLNGIFINASGCPGNDPTRCSFPNTSAVFSGSWGYRSRAAADGGKTYVAISAGLWPAAGSAAWPLHVYETQVLQSFPGAGAAAVSSANPDASWMSVLAALAHEVGHVRFVQTVKPPPGNNYDFNSLINCSSGNFFAGWSYDHHNPKHPHFQPRGGWRGFAERLNDAGSPIDHANPPLLSQLDMPPPRSYPYLLQLYQANQPWASLFAAQTPDEDFVETYVMAVFTGYTASSHSFAGPLTSLAVSVPGISGSPDIPQDLLSGRKSGLANKMSCLVL